MDNVLSQINEYVESKKDEMVEFWGKIVSLESYSGDKEDVNKLAEYLKSEFEKENLECKLIEVGANSGNTLVGTLGSERKGEPIILSGHMNTVFPRGYLKDNPFKIEDGKAYGPGALDMKGGIVISLYIIKALNNIGYDERPIKIIFSGDEEVGHINSQGAEVILEEAKGGICAFNMETGLVDNAVCIGRKGRVGYKIVVSGVGAHAGNDFSSGINAIEEMAYKIIDLQKLTNLEVGTTISVGTIEGGTVSNAIPEHCEVEVDVRFENVEEMENIKSQIENLCKKTYVKGSETECEVISSMAPYEITEDVIKFYDFCNQIAKENEFETMGSKRLGGGSDASYITIAGTPVVCSFGVRGQWNHTDNEYAIVDSLFERTKLITTIILNLEKFDN